MHEDPSYPNIIEEFSWGLPRRVPDIGFVRGSRKGLRAGSLFRP